MNAAEKTAFEMGSSAFHNGIENKPANDADFMNFLNTQKKYRIAIIKSWISGWINA